MKIMRNMLIGIIKAYRALISPLCPPCCRFEPTCSAYAIEALRRYGAVRGLYLTAKRVLKCHPWSRGGYDPVPQQKCDCYNEENVKGV